LKHKLLLTFDVEDFINPNAIFALQKILESLQKYNLKAIFFITAHMAEKLSNYPKIIDSLKKHEIGYHSSSHSVHPTIPEYTDVESYIKAYNISIRIETSHINPFIGKPERDGGIYFLQDLFYPKKIKAFRAPGMCWSPPHLEALRDLGIKYDFSSNITTSEPVYYKEITFYPYTFTQKWNGNLYDYKCLFAAILKRKVAVLDIHPTLFVNQTIWDNIFYKGNPKKLYRSRKRPLKETISLFKKFESLLKYVTLLYHMKLIDVNPDLNIKPKDLAINRCMVEKCYETSMRWPIRWFNLNPKYIRSHFYKFFEIISQ